MRSIPAVLVPFALVTVTACGGKKDPAPAAPPTGWHQEDGWAASCWMPVDYENVAETEGSTARLQARQAAQEAMISQWRGQRDDGVSFRMGSVDDLEVTLWGRPELVEEVSRQNAAQCRDVMNAGVSTEDEVPSTLGDMTAWKTWFGGLNGRLTEGECAGGLEDTLFYYLEITTGWQLDVPVCEGGSYLIRATENDKYRITEDGPWINTEGDLDQLTMGMEDMPCNMENCYGGMLVARFTTDTGIETILPVGVEMVFNVPAHGRLSIRINDLTFFDNTWHQSGGIIDHTAVEISPQ